MDGGKGNHITADIVGKEVVQLGKDFGHIGASASDDFNASDLILQGHHERGGAGVKSFALGTATGKVDFVVKFFQQGADSTGLGFVHKVFEALANITAFDIGRNAVGNQFEAEAHKGGRLTAKHHIASRKAVKTSGALDFALASTLKGIDIRNILLGKGDLGLTATIAHGQGEFVIVGDTGKVGERLAVRTSKAVNRLHRVTNGHETAIGSKGGKQEFLLGLVQVLGLVHEYEVITGDIPLCAKNAGGNHIHEINRGVQPIGRRKAGADNLHFVTREVKTKVAGDFLNPTDFARLDKVYTALVQQVLAVADKAVTE